MTTAPAASGAPPASFDRALQERQDRNHAAAAALFFESLRGASDDETHVEHARFFLAEALDALGVMHAAAHYYQRVASTRTRPELLPQALQRLHHMTQTAPFDTLLVHDSLLVETDFGSLPPDLQDWVNFVQGLSDYRNGSERWGAARFRGINPSSPYAARAAYVQAVAQLSAGDDGPARRALAALASAAQFGPEAPGPATNAATSATANQARWALARLSFDSRDYHRAAILYDAVTPPDTPFAQAELLLEKAWLTYQLQRLQAALGMLQALDAPNYRDFFLPGRYLLRALILKDLCHFMPAKAAIRDFRVAYDDALRALRDRAPLHTLATLTRAATQDGELASQARLLDALRLQRDTVATYEGAWEEAGLDRHLRRLYDLALRDAGERWLASLRPELENRAEELLAAAEQMDLLDYEIGLAIFRRSAVNESNESNKSNAPATTTDPGGASMPSGAGAAAQPGNGDVATQPRPAAATRHYDFDGEYWADELHSYRYDISSRCVAPGGA